jgi:hypothetical protein
LHALEYEDEVESEEGAEECVALIPGIECNHEIELGRRKALKESAAIECIGRHREALGNREVLRNCHICKCVAASTVRKVVEHRMVIIARASGWKAARTGRSQSVPGTPFLPSIQKVQRLMQR